jgi:hypothetical protein
MMDDLKYVFTVDDKDIIATIKNHEVLEKRVGSLTKQYAVLDKALNEGRIDLVDYGKAVAQLDKQIAHVEATLKKGGSAVNQMATGMNVSGKAGRRMELQFQQAGYQIQDFIVQVQGGVNPLIAFSQQGSQLAGFFAGPWGAAIGLGIAAMSSLAMVMFSTTEETTKTVDIFKNLTEATNQLYLERMKLIDPKFDENLIGTQEELKRLTEAYDKAKAAAESVVLGRFGASANAAGKVAQETAAAAVKEAKAKLDAYNTEIGLIEARRLNNERIDAQNEQAIRDLETQQSLQDEFNRKLAKAHEIYAKTRLEAAGLARETANAVNALNQMKIEFSPGGQAMMKYGSRGVADNREPIFGNGESIYPKVSTGGGGGGGSIGGETQEEYITKLIREYDTKKKSLGLTDEQVKRTEFLFNLDEKLSTMKTKRSEVEIETEKQKAIAAYDAYAAAEKQAAIMATVTGSLENMFMSFVDGTKSVGDAFKGMLRDIILQIYQDQIAKTAATGIGNFLSGLFKSANGNVFQGGSHVSAYANGGVVGSPTYFPMSGGKTGLMGEAGPEAIMPLKRGANGKLGVQVDGNSGGSVVVNQTFNFSANGDESVKKIIAQAAPQIAQMTQQKIMDSRRRGGSMKAAFG